MGEAKRRKQLDPYYGKRQLVTSETNLWNEFIALTPLPEFWEQLFASTAWKGYQTLGIGILVREIPNLDNVSKCVYLSIEEFKERFNPPWEVVQLITRIDPHKEFALCQVLSEINYQVFTVASFTPPPVASQNLTLELELELEKDHE